MKIRIASLRAGDNSISEKLSPGELGLNPENYQYPVWITGSIESGSHLYRARLHVETVRDCICDRCAVDFEMDMELDLQVHIMLRSPRDKDEAETEGLLFVGARDNEIDFSPVIKEEILLSEPFKYLCNDDCKGLCLKCGADLNEGDCGCESENQNKE